MLFYRASDGIKILLHKPHPGDKMSIANTEYSYEKLNEIGEI